MDRGVVFLASVPTNMRPSEVRLHLQQFGELFRHKFVPMPKKYVGSGSHRKLLPLQYKNAYVEFMNRDNAKLCAEQLNGSAVASKRRRKCFGQIWNIKFMGDGFTWGNVLEEREEQVRKHQQLEFSFKESERRANEAFRKMVLRQSAAADAKRHNTHDPDGETVPVDDAAAQDCTRSGKRSRAVPDEGGAEATGSPNEPIEEPKESRRTKRRTEVRGERKP